MGGDSCWEQKERKGKERSLDSMMAYVSRREKFLPLPSPTLPSTKNDADVASVNFGSHKTKLQHFLNGRGPMHIVSLCLLPTVGPNLRCCRLHSELFLRESGLPWVSPPILPCQKLVARDGSRAASVRRQV